MSSTATWLTATNTANISMYNYAAPDAENKCPIAALLGKMGRHSVAA
jgi:hypothetical protein